MFKVGDIIRCIKAHNESLINGQIYKVTAISNYEGGPGFVKINNPPDNGGWHAYRFELATDLTKLERILYEVEDNG